jgi:hypothetical protein
VNESGIRSIIVSVSQLLTNDLGAFGKVLKGIMLSSTPTQPLDVAIKTIKSKLELLLVYYVHLHKKQNNSPTRFLELEILLFRCVIP